MEPVRRRWRDLPLRKALVVYITVAVLLALVLCEMTANLCDLGVRKIRAAYPNTMEKYYLTNERGERLGEGTYIGTDVIPLTPEDQRTVDILRALPTVTTPVWSALCILGAALLFYRNKLKRPLAELRLASEKISQNDLDFTVAIYSRDELGQLSASFETMRAALARNFLEIWRQMEERKRLNAAFAHDLRNPVTVLKGSVTLLRQGSRDPQLLDRLERYTQRIAEYVEAMGGVQRLEQLPVRPAPIDSAVLAAELAETARLLAPRLTASLSAPAPGPVALDHGILLTVAENLIGNAARFGRERLEIALTREGDTLTLMVADDGPGFPPELLRDGPKPFGRLAEDPEHFGMGLYSSRLLCQKHGGELRLQNRPAGGAAAAASFRISPGP